MQHQMFQPKMDTCSAHVVNPYQQHWNCSNEIAVSKSISVSVNVTLQLCQCALKK